jgi:hypothetical protein
VGEFESSSFSSQQSAATLASITFNVLPKTQTVPVAVFYLEVAATIGLVTNSTRDIHAFRLRGCIKTSNGRLGG